MEPASAALAAYILTLASALSVDGGDTVERDRWDPYLHIGQQINATDARVGGVGVIYTADNGRQLDLSITFMSEGYTNWGVSESVRIFSITRIINPGWGCWLINTEFFMGIGYANVQTTRLVGEHNFNAIVGCRLGDWARLYYQHESDWGIGTNYNTGLDGFHFSVHKLF